MHRRFYIAGQTLFLTTTMDEWIPPVSKDEPQKTLPIWARGMVWFRERMGWPAGFITTYG
jgi:hypothetical protein